MHFFRESHFHEKFHEIDFTIIYSQFFYASGHSAATQQPQNEVSNQTEGVNEEANNLLSSGSVLTTRETSNVVSTGEVSEETAILAAASAGPLASVTMHSELEFFLKVHF